MFHQRVPNATNVVDSVPLTRVVKLHETLLQLLQTREPHRRFVLDKVLSDPENTLLVHLYLVRDVVFVRQRASYSHSPRVKAYQAP